MFLRYEQYNRKTTGGKMAFYPNLNKCIGDDTKAAACRSPNCIRKTKQIRRRTIFNLEIGFFFPLQFNFVQIRPPAAE